MLPVAWTYPLFADIREFRCRFGITIMQRGTKIIIIFLPIAVNHQLAKHQVSPRIEQAIPVPMNL
ncbi:hypothetical protein BpHYR1_032268 [Brachionus plicatilis]|uniref:Uncharacterized protein n=1 Tax=Brachionus plicatilis TaxID=10195 RepID=A0A3M7SP08_BRAPC|nr:hypothetical protein BpHYR1_032268 [Brachionus plicatilis]